MKVLKAIYHGILDGWHGSSDYKYQYLLNSTDEEVEEVDKKPFYIVDLIAAYDLKIDSLSEMLKLLQSEYDGTMDKKKKAQLSIKMADILEKIARYNAKINKLE